MQNNLFQSMLLEMANFRRSFRGYVTWNGLIYSTYKMRKQ